MSKNSKGGLSRQCGRIEPADAYSGPIRRKRLGKRSGGPNRRLGRGIRSIQNATGQAPQG